MSDELAPQETTEMSGSDAKGPFSDAHPPPLDFDGWCDLAVELLQRDMEERFEILAERDVEPTLWQHCDRYWSLALAGEIAVGGSKRVDTYAQRCAAEMAARREGGDSAEPAPDQDSTSRPDSSDLDETSWLMQAPIGPVLPFDESVKVPTPSEVVKATDQRPDLAGKTALATPVVGDRDATLPFSPAVGPREEAHDSSPKATAVGHSPTTAASQQEQRALESYASLCAKLTAYPAHAAQIRTSYGIASEEQLATCHTRWQTEFRAKPALRQRFEQLQQEHLRHLAERQATHSPSTQGSGDRRP